MPLRELRAVRILMQKKILIINANTDLACTKRQEEACRRIAYPGISVRAVSPDVTSTFDVPSIKCEVDNALATVETLKVVAREQENCDGIILACFSDTGLDAAREMTEIPILGIAETSYIIACLIAHKFSVLTYTKKFTPPKEKALRALGLNLRVASLRYYDDTRNAEERIRSSAQLVKQCAEEDGAEAVILGGGGFAGFGPAISEAAGDIVPVIDPTTATFSVMEALLSLGLSHSKAGMWQKIIPATIDGRSYVRPFDISGSV